MSTDNTATDSKKKQHFNLVLGDTAEADLKYIAGRLDIPRSAAVREAIKMLRGSLSVLDEKK
jgi:hypothetical protein